jgi:hypothetical protein
MMNTCPTCHQPTELWIDDGGTMVCADLHDFFRCKACGASIDGVGSLRKPSFVCRRCKRQFLIDKFRSWIKNLAPLRRREKNPQQGQGLAHGTSSAVPSLHTRGDTRRHVGRTPAKRPHRSTNRHEGFVAGKVGIELPSFLG